MAHFNDHCTSTITCNLASHLKSEILIPCVTNFGWLSNFDPFQMPTFPHMRKPIKKTSLNNGLVTFNSSLQKLENVPCRVDVFLLFAIFNLSLHPWRWPLHSTCEMYYEEQKETSKSIRWKEPKSTPLRLLWGLIHFRCPYLYIIGICCGLGTSRLCRIVIRSMDPTNQSVAYNYFSSICTPSNPIFHERANRSGRIVENGEWPLLKH